MAISNVPIVFERARVVAGTTVILENVDLQIVAGPPTVIIGPNGSGKTTLLRAAMGLLSLTEGSVTWGGNDIGVPVKRAMLFQRPTMLRRTAQANVIYALKKGYVTRDKHVERAKELLRLVGLEHLGARAARRMSGGEQQRVALARALAQDPEVLFLDEPTANLDPFTTRDFEELVCKIADRGVKIVISTHDLGVARRLAGDVVMLHRGRVVEHTLAPRFFANPGTEAAKAFTQGQLLV
jgi:tungstate transport system ATP-binding protein